MKKQKLIKLRLVVDVDIDPNGMDSAQARDLVQANLDKVANRMMVEGWSWITGDSDAFVETWNYSVKQQRK